LAMVHFDRGDCNRVGGLGVQTSFQRGQGVTLVAIR
jgi:hypothetical protein